MTSSSERVSDDSSKAAAAQPVIAERMPESIRHMSQEERDKLELRMRRKIDWRLMPMMVIMYILNYLDRNNIATARLAGLETELRLSSAQYQVVMDGLLIGFKLMVLNDLVDFRVDIVCGIHLDARYCVLFATFNSL